MRDFDASRLQSRNGEKTKREKMKKRVAANNIRSRRVINKIILLSKDK